MFHPECQPDLAAVTVWQAQNMVVVKAQIDVPHLVIRMIMLRKPDVIRGLFRIRRERILQNAS